MKRKTKPSQAGPNRNAANREPGRWTKVKLNGCLALLGDQGHLHRIVSNYPSGLDRGFLGIDLGVMAHGWQDVDWIWFPDSGRGPCARLEDGGTRQGYLRNV
ncbi:hypothetical protein N7465_004946 [Penicillium sp. CMV-2018d]|nr:hypothetical protein N7465_004946 [Penicillium sp. CMV-2018d]